MRRERAGISEKFLSCCEGLSLRNVKLLALNARNDVKILYTEIILAQGPC